MAKLKHLVFSGGSTNVLGFLGFLKFLSENNLLNDIESYTGTSAGAVLSYFLSIGFTWLEIYQFNKFFDHKKVIDFDLTNFIQNYGFCTIDKFTHFLIKMVEYKNIDPKITFKEHFELTKIKVTLAGSCINDSCIEFFNYETSPDMEIVQALRITCCIPFIFSPIIYKNKIYLDGGIFLNYPIEYNDHQLDETLGMRTKDDCVNKCHVDVSSLTSYMSAVLKCVINGDTKKISDKYDKYTLNYSFEMGVFLKNTTTVDEIDEMFEKCYKEVQNQIYKIDRFLENNVKPKINENIDDINLDSEKIESLAKDIENSTEEIYDFDSESNIDTFISNDEATSKDCES